MPSALIFYQYFHPDDVVSSTHLTDFAAGLVSRGWQVTALPCNRSCRKRSIRFAAHSTYGGVHIRRLWRPAFSQSSTWGRLANSAWMLARWCLSAFKYKPDVVIIGTDPVLSAAVAIPWKLIRRKTQTVHWCFDLYPEAAVADGLLKDGKTLGLLRSLMCQSYKRLDLIADLGDCMRQRLLQYGSPAKHTTLPPWAIAEPAQPLTIDLEERAAIFGNAKLALMYSGNFGRAHSYAELLLIARQMRDADAHFAFSIRGNRVTELRNSVRTDDSNISFVPFASTDGLEARLSAPDIHVVSLRKEWTGTVVPSKFFGALAAGRPVLFIGSEDSCIARLIREHGVGWVCPPGGERDVAIRLRRLSERPQSISELHAHCHRVYQTHFRRDVILDCFDYELRSLLGEICPRIADSSGTAKHQVASA